MCTVTYLPIAESGFILTSSRDEKAIRRAALTPKTEVIGEQTILYPKDAQGGGTWIATSGTKTVCLLNGAFKPHQPLSHYKHSRGKVLVSLFNYTSSYDFVTHYPFTGIEPFTLIVAEHKHLFELRWNGIRWYLKELDAALPYIWSSVTLYNPEVSARRKTWFKDWLLLTDEYSIDTIRHFHKTAGDGDPSTSIVMNRNNEICTVSLTSIISKSGDVEMIYEDLLRQQTHRAILADTAQISQVL